MFLSACYIPGTVIALLFSLNISTLLSISKFKEAWFARFWADYGPDAREGAPDNAKPFIKQAYGVVLEIGPGNGGWVGDYDKEKVTKIYGVEPNKDHHTKLRQKVIEAGLGDIYVICGVGVEDLGERWVKRGDVDCVVTVLLPLLIGCRVERNVRIENADINRYNASARFQIRMK